MNIETFTPPVAAPTPEIHPTTPLRRIGPVLPAHPARAARSVAGHQVMLRLHRRGLTLKRVCELSGVNRAHLSQLLHGARDGRNTAWRVVPFLLAEEIDALGWHSHLARALEKFGQIISRRAIPPAGVAQAPAGNAPSEIR